MTGDYIRDHVTDVTDALRKTVHMVKSIRYDALSIAFVALPAVCAAVCHLQIGYS